MIGDTETESNSQARVQAEVAEDYRDRRGAGDAVFVAANLLVGIWLLVSPYLYKGALIDEHDDFLIGVALVLVGCYSAYRAYRRLSLSPSAVMLSFFAGLWLVSFTLTYGEQTLMHDNVFVGAVLAIVSALVFRLVIPPDRR